MIYAQERTGNSPFPLFRFIERELIKNVKRKQKKNLLFKNDKKYNSIHSFIQTPFQM